VWFNPACFTKALGELGDANRVPVVGPDYVNTDFSIIKQFALPREGMGLNFRAEFFNLFNHTHFGMPGSDLGVATVDLTGKIISPNGFGSVNSTLDDPRLVQLALKLTF
jgi:hypothetical protein